MRDLYNSFVKQRGMTLLEMVVTLGVLSVVLMGTLTIYSTTYRNFRTHDNMLNIIHDSESVMSTLGNDIRHAQQLLENYQDSDLRTMVAAMKIRTDAPEQNEQQIVVYSRDRNQPNRLFRSVYRQDKVISVELSTRIQALNIIPKSDKLIEVQLTVEDKVAGQLSILQTSSVYAMRN